MGNVRIARLVEWRSFGSVRAVMKTKSIAELQRAGVALAAHEAVAIAQQLIHDRSARAPEPPFGLPSPDTVSIDAGGAVVCRGCEVTPTAPEIAMFLHAALSKTPRVPGGLRYAIGRALHEVEAPPFDSVDAFSLALARYERGPRRDVLRALAARVEWDRAGASIARIIVDRRRTMPSPTELRRLLREADRQLFERRADAAPPPQTSRPMRACLRIVGAVTLCVLTTGGVSSSRPREDRVPALSAPSALERVAPELAGVAVARTAERAAPQESAAPHVKTAAVASSSRNSAPRTASERTPPRDRRLQTRTIGPRGALAKVRLPWLRRVIVVRDDF